MNFKERLEPPKKSQILEQDGYFIWCGSAVKDKKGKYHMFASRWEKSKSFRAWITDCRIIRAVSDYPEGPYKIIEQLDSLHDQAWCSGNAHNPTIKEIDGIYYLFFTGTTYEEKGMDLMSYDWFQIPRFNQRIGVAVAGSPEGPWRLSPNNPILAPREEGFWDSTFVSNPAVFVDDDGQIKLIYKAKIHNEKRTTLGLAVASDPEGPYKRVEPSPLFQFHVEDPYIWKEEGIYRMIAKAMNDEIVARGCGVLFQSVNGIDWEVSENKEAWDKVICWEGGAKEFVKHLERPQLLIVDGKPICFYAAIGDFGAHQLATYSYNLAWKMK